MHDTVDDLEVEAYLNDQLDLAGRTAVERVLARNPQQAARVMADLHVRNTLRAVLGNEPVQSGTRIDLAARRLERGLNRSHLKRGMRQAALAAACVALGWLVHWQLDSFGIATTEAASPPPRFVAEALQAHRTSLLRSLMASQIEAPEFDRTEILNSTAIPLPEFPEDWHILDVQVYPAAMGPSVVVMFSTTNSGPFSLYMAQMNSRGDAPLRFSRDGERHVAYWRSGKLGLALTGQASAVEIRQTAKSLGDAIRSTTQDPAAH
jgi:anti-sigma factor RsiW